MTRPREDGDDNSAAYDRRGFKVLSIAGGIALAVLLVALGTPRDAETEPWTDSAPAVVPVTPTAEAVAALDAGVDWQHVEVWTEFGPAAVAAYER